MYFSLADRILALLALPLLSRCKEGVLPVNQKMPCMQQYVSHNQAQKCTLKQRMLSVLSEIEILI